MRQLTLRFVIMSAELRCPLVANLDDLLLTEVMRFLPHSIIQHLPHVLVRPVRFHSQGHTPKPFSIGKFLQVHVI